MGRPWRVNIDPLHQVWRFDVGLVLTSFPQLHPHSHFAQHWQHSYFLRSCGCAGPRRCPRMWHSCQPLGRLQLCIFQHGQRDESCNLATAWCQTYCHNYNYSTGQRQENNLSSRMWMRLGLNMLCYVCKVVFLITYTCVLSIFPRIYLFAILFIEEIDDFVTWMKSWRHFREIAEDTGRTEITWFEFSRVMWRLLFICCQNQTGLISTTLNKVIKLKRFMKPVPSVVIN